MLDSTAMASRLARATGILAYAFLLLLVFGLASYVSFSLFVRSGVTTVPSLEGLTRAEAAGRLADQGLRLRGVEDEGRYDEKVPAGRVLRQEPDARTLVKRGSGVQVVLSKGPQRIEVPDLAGRSFPAAQVALSGAGLAVGGSLAVERADKEAGSVVAQDPDPGALVPPATPVDLLLAAPAPGERYIMPDLVYRRYEDVRPLFERQRFRFGSVKFERYEGVAAGTILRQFPLPGHPVSRDDSISLIVATTEAAENIAG